MANEGKKTFSLNVDLKSELDAFLVDNALTHNEAMRLMLSSAKSQLTKLNQSKRATEVETMQQLLRQVMDCFNSCWAYNETTEGRIKANFENDLQNTNSELEKARLTIDDLNATIDSLRTEFLELNEQHKLEIKEFQNENQILTRKYAELEKEHIQSLKFIKALEENKARLEADVDKLKSADSIIKELENEIDSIKKSKVEYSESVKNKAVTEVKEAFSVALKAKDEQIEMLKNLINKTAP